MRRIAQISDLHFGAHEPAAVAALYDALTALRPDLVVVSGDLTQRARIEQFAQADAFLARLEAAGLALLVVPGNHDVPMHRPLSRLFWPLRRYRRIVQRDRPCRFADAELAVLGLASAHGLTVKDGRLTQRQVRSIATSFADADPAAIRVLVTHHPLVPLPGDEPGEIEPALRGAGRTLRAVRDADVHLVLAGHHHAHSVTFAGDRQVMVVQAGTATSYRRRGAPNGFNLVELSPAGATPARATIAEWTSGAGEPFACTARITCERASRAGWVATSA